MWLGKVKLIPLRKFSTTAYHDHLLHDHHIVLLQSYTVRYSKRCPKHENIFKNTWGNWKYIVFNEILLNYNIHHTRSSISYYGFTSVNSKLLFQSSVCISDWFVISWQSIRFLDKNVEKFHDSLETMSKCVSQCIRSPGILKTTVINLGQTPYDFFFKWNYKFVKIGLIQRQIFATFFKSFT